jgi:predicted RNA-binding protein with PIN domain
LFILPADANCQTIPESIMHYLIDGHNLIAKMPDIALDDPNDEVMLVLRLRSWAAGSRKRQITVIFDRGLPGGRSKFLSRGQVDVIFAPEGQTADTLLISRIRQAANPGEYTLISSDRQVLAVARDRRMQHIPANVFAERLGQAGRKEQAVPDGLSPDQADDLDLSPEEIAEWLALFESAPRIDPPPAQPSPQPRADAKSPAAGRKKSRPKEAPDPAALKDGARKLSDDDVDEWLRLFGQSDRE